MAAEPSGRVTLISIHPRFAEAIFRGEKGVELRRSAFGDDVCRVIVYVTAPVQRIIGWFEVNGIDRAAPQTLWRRYGDLAGVTYGEFRSYFDGASQGAAIKVGRRVPLRDPVSLTELPRPFGAPQSYCYLDEGSIKYIEARRDQTRQPLVGSSR